MYPRSCHWMPFSYSSTVISQADTFDKVISDQVDEGAAVLAARAWNVPKLPEAFPHHGSVRSGVLVAGLFGTQRRQGRPASNASQ